jgi:hypothetical protein
LPTGGANVVVVVVVVKGDVMEEREGVDTDR